MLLRGIDAYGKSGWIGLTVASFWIAWPLGLALVAFLVVSGRVQAWRDEFRLPGTWFNLGQGPAARRPWPAYGKPSGNFAFDEYRERTIRDLEEDQREFQAYLERLRKARDKAEFDAFMAERRNRTQGADAQA